jgi:hypothetical protein
MTETTRSEEFTIDGKSVMAKLKELLHQGNIRRITVKNQDGQVYFDLPLTIGVAGAILAPAAAALGAIAALAGELTIAVEKVEAQQETPAES